MSMKMTQDMNAEYVSSPQAAKILRITYVGVAQLARQGKIPAVKIANRWLIPRAFVEEFAQTYVGRRGRPRKIGPPVEVPEVTAVVQPGQSALADSGTAAGVMAPGLESDEIRAVYSPTAHLEETPAPPIHLGELPTGDAGLAPEIVASPELESRPPSGPGEPTGQPGEVPAVAPPASELEMSEVAGLSEVTDTSRSSDNTFSTSAKVYHLDKNYDFEVYEKGEITERARLIVARLKPKIPSLPQFSFRWDYRYEHLNVDIHGVDPAVVDWWTMGENGYTGHLPRRLGGPGYVFEAVIWLPVTFVFRGRLTLSLRDRLPEEEESPSVATTTGGLRKLWAKWPRIRSGE